MPVSTLPRHVLITYSAFLLFGGALAFVQSGFNPKAKWELVTGVFSCAVTLVVADQLPPGDIAPQGFIKAMAFGLPLLFTFVFLAFISHFYDRGLHLQEGKEPIFLLLAVLASGSAAAFFMILRYKPSAKVQ